MSFSNPVIPGFYPDPSICRVGDDYYLVTSSFEYFPGVPLFHSRDLLNWRQIGHVLTRDSQLPLAGCRASGGIYAPTIRHNDGRFYMVTTNVTAGGNFLVYTDDITGEWSEPVWIDQEGIDPSLLFDDGKAYLTTSRNWQSEIDVSSGRLLTPKRQTWTGTGGGHLEAPHLYRLGNVYYLMAAEGGTGRGHMVTIARAASPWGPFEACPHNPILTNRGEVGQPLQATGHGDLFQAADGRWWMVFLGIRDKPGMFPRVHNLGRETCLAPVRWTDTGWPVVGEDGHVGLTVDAQAYGEQDTNYIDTETDFAELGHEWNFLRNPDPATWSLEPEGLRLHGNASTLSDREAKAFVGRRQQHDRFEATTTLDFEPERVGDEAGLTVRMNETHHYELALVAEPTGRSLILRRTIGDLSAVTARLRAPGRHLEIGVRGDQERYTFYFSTEHGGDLVVGTGAARHLSTEVAGGFTGVYIGLYASGNGASCDAPAFFSRFGYRGRESPIASTK